MASSLGEKSVLNSWFEKNKRDFPWRGSPTPYGVWVSEVMLQQTRASVVIPYFELWMATFPDVASLAAAPIDQVIKLWEGLGYYSRARNLYAGAQQIVREFGGEVPSTKEGLLQIRGLGPYTVAAILSFGFKKRAAAVDGNVLRVITRYAWIDEDIQKVATKRKVTEFVEAFLDEEKPWVTSEALIELGATICTQVPRCDHCPIQEGCKAFARDQVDVLPIKSSKQKIEKIIRGVAVIEVEGFILVRENIAGKIMADLCEFPYFEGKKTVFAIQKELSSLGLNVELIQPLDSVKHTFTRYSATLYPFFFKATSRNGIKDHLWISIERLKQSPFSSGHRKIYHQLGSFL
jgi:A/G-specific adenine glycosylase